MIKKYLTKFTAWVSGKMICTWTEAYTYWSIKLSAFGTLVFGLLAMWPDGALYAWQMMPYEVKAWLPDNLTAFAAAVIFGLTMLSRVYKQSKK